MGLKRVLHGTVDGPAGAQHGGGIGTPGGSLLGQRARRVLALPGSERGLLCQVLALDRGRWSPVIALKLGPELGQGGLDVGPARRPGTQQLGVESDDLADCSLTVRGGAVGEPDTEPLAQ